jgi:hypothetical protein
VLTNGPRFKYGGHRYPRGSRFELEDNVLRAPFIYGTEQLRALKGIWVAAQRNSQALGNVAANRRIALQHLELRSLSPLWPGRWISATNRKAVGQNVTAVQVAVSSLLTRSHSVVRPSFSGFKGLYRKRYSRRPCESKCRHGVERNFESARYRPKC